MSVMINDPTLAKLWSEIMLELKRAQSLHPYYAADHLRRTAIMMEEAGEAVKAALELTRDGDSSPVEKLEMKEELRAELIQTAAMAIRQLVAMEVEDGGSNEQPK